MREQQLVFNGPSIEQIENFILAPSHEVGDHLVIKSATGVDLPFVPFADGKDTKEDSGVVQYHGVCCGGDAVYSYCLKTSAACFSFENPDVPVKIKTVEWPDQSVA